MTSSETLVSALAVMGFHSLLAKPGPARLPPNGIRVAGPERRLFNGVLDVGFQDQRTRVYLLMPEFVWR